MTYFTYPPPPRHIFSTRTLNTSPLNHIQIQWVQYHFYARSRATQRCCPGLITWIATVSAYECIYYAWVWVWAYVWARAEGARRGNVANYLGIMQASKKLPASVCSHPLHLQLTSFFYFISLLVKVITISKGSLLQLHVSTSGLSNTPGQRD